jgi:hypothetical protein
MRLTAYCLLIKNSSMALLAMTFKKSFKEVEEIPMSRRQLRQ